MRPKNDVWEEILCLGCFDVSLQLQVTCYMVPCLLGSGGAWFTRECVSLGTVGMCRQFFWCVVLCLCNLFECDGRVIPLGTTPSCLSFPDDELSFWNTSWEQQLLVNGVTLSVCVWALLNACINPSIIHSRTLEQSRSCNQRNSRLMGMGNPRERCTKKTRFTTTGYRVRDGTGKASKYTGRWYSSWLVRDGIPPATTLADHRLL